MPYHRLLAALKDDKMLLINEFIFTFMRFEYALKGSQYFMANSTDAKADWGRFSTDISLTFDKNKSTHLRQSVDFLLNDPPEKQVIDNGSLVFSNVLSQYPYDTQNLDVYIRRVRNNLFHGSKFTQNNDLPRDLELINASLIVLKEWVEILPDVSEKFHKLITENNKP